MSTFERWSLLVASFAVLVNVVAFAVVLLQLRLLARQLAEGRRATERDHDRRRKEATLNTVSQFVSLLAKLREDGLADEYDPEGAALFLADAMADDYRKKKLLMIYLNEFERMANGARFDVYDISVLDRTVGTRMMLVMDRYRPLIDRGRLRRRNPDLLGDLEWLADIVRTRRGPQGEWLGDTQHHERESKDGFGQTSASSNAHAQV